jgi:DNA-directed RNA polymerase alpha subunit
MASSEVLEAPAEESAVSEQPEVDAPNLDHEALEQIRAAESVVAAKEMMLEEASRAKKLAQAAFDDAVASLRATIRAQSQVLPLFEQEPEAWRSVALAELTTNGRVLNALSGAKLFTLGELTDWQNDTDRLLTDIKGIGEKAAEELQQAIDEYWAKNPLPEDESTE